jgi:hypothetical protein
MSRLDAQFIATGLPALFEQLGRSVTFTPDGGAPVTLTAIVGEEVISDEDVGQGKVRIRRREVKITRDPAGPYGGVADPLPTGRVTVDELVYEIEDDEEISRSAAIAVLSLVRFESMDKGSYHFRE